MRQPDRGAALRNLLAAGATAFALLLAYTINVETRRLGTEFRLGQERTLARVGRVAMLGQETLIEPPAVLLFKSVPDSLKPIVGALMPLVGANSKQLVATAATWFGYILDCDSIPAVLALRGMCWRGLRLRNQAVDDLLRASWRAGTDEELVRQIAYGYAGLTLAETGYGVHRDNSLLGDSLLRRALVYYDSAIQFEAGAYAMDMFIRSFRERVRTTLGEDQKEVDRTKPSRAATRLFCTGMLLCIVGALAAIFELVKR